MKTKIITGLFLISLLFIVGCNSDGINLDSFATCLSDNGAEMYGAYWCGHCKNQKEMFGESFDKVNYIECTTDQLKCQQAGIQGYPTWKFEDGSATPGVQQFADLAKKTGCRIP